jgi:hypothetical protein
MKRWREENRAESDGFVELDWAPGTAQVDFGMSKAGRGRGARRARAGGLVAVFEHALLRRVAGRERRMRMRGPVPPDQISVDLMVALKHV